tara:strand:- start:2364 stop:2795 length:432 start_codon:yes stop_codon:yes gene_type:complete
MSDEFLKYGKETIFRDLSRGGLFAKFLKSYSEEFGNKKLNPACSSCRTEYWNNYLNLFKMKTENKSKYTLKAKYNGIQLGINGQPIRNGEMTDKQAFELLKKHPRGADLFEEAPVKVKAVKKAVKKVVKEEVKEQEVVETIKK